MTTLTLNNLFLNYSDVIFVKCELCRAWVAAGWDDKQKHLEFHQSLVELVAIQVSLTQQLAG